MEKRHVICVYILLAFIFARTGISAEPPSSINQRGVDLGNKKMYREAISEFDRAIAEYDRDSALAYHNRGWAQELSGDTEGAIASYEEALRRYPGQIITGERLGYLYYRKADYPNAVRVGEQVLKYMPDDKAVLAWLSDAYTKKLNQEKEKRLARKETVQEILDREKEEKKKRERHMVLLATADFTLRSGYFLTGDRGYRYIPDEGLLGDIPESLMLRFTPIRAWEFTLRAENPHLGALAPDLISQTGTVESLYRLGSFKLGMGFMLSRSETSDLAFDRDLSLLDFKTGFLFGYNRDRVDYTLRFYPRFLPHDTKNSSRYTLDTGLLDFVYTYSVSRELKYYSLFSFRDYYIFNNTAEIADYWGVYDIGLGVTLGDISINNTGFAWALTIEFRQRFYLESLEEDNPYTKVPNGQGWFGMDLGQWTKGEPFSGFRTSGSEISFRVDEQFISNMFVYQKLIVEMNEEVQEFNFQMGAGGMF
jgi:tetratricopeptide (TPR) repeat protein